MVAAVARTRKSRVPPLVYSAPMGPALKNLLLALWEFARWQRDEDESVFVWPRVDTLASTLGISVRSVYRSLAGLVELGFVERATQTIAMHARGEPDEFRRCAGFMLHPTPSGRREVVESSELERHEQLGLWSESRAPSLDRDGIDSDLRQDRHSASFRGTCSDQPRSRPRADAPACAIDRDPQTKDDDDQARQEETRPVTATESARPTLTLVTTKPPDEREAARVVWELHETTRVSARVGDPHRGAAPPHAIDAVLALHRHVRTSLALDDDRAWAALDCYARGAVRLAAEARDMGRKCAPMLLRSRCDWREWDPSRFDKTWGGIDRVEWRVVEQQRSAKRAVEETDELIAERRAWEAADDRITPDKLDEFMRTHASKWKIGAAISRGCT